MSRLDRTHVVRTLALAAVLFALRRPAWAAAPSPGVTPLPPATVTPSGGPSPSVGPSPIGAAAVDDATVEDVVRHGAPRHAILRAQILLDRARFSVGEIDAGYGANTRRAVAAFQTARGLPPSGEVDAATWAALAAGSASMLAAYTLTAEDVTGPFVPIPSPMMEKAKLDRLGYASPLEALGERFHSSPALLVELNPGRRIAAAGDEIVVPAIVSAPPVEAREVIVDASDRSLIVVDAAGAVFARYPATTGSAHDPLPVGTWQINGVRHDPEFRYNPRLFWDADARDRAATIAPGPNNPVGVVWIDLSKPHYGIHGTPEPSLIGRTQSHGCIRLTNWSAEELSRAVKYGTPVILRD